MSNNEELAIQLAKEYFRTNPVPPSQINEVIDTFRRSVSGLTNALDRNQEPAVPAKKSIHPDYIICLEDGKKLKMLKRYLRTQYDLSPEEYRRKWSLEPDYPMVAPNYSKRRSDFAKEFGLGKVNWRSAATKRKAAAKKAAKVEGSQAA